MAKDWLTVIRYLISAEDSRLGRVDYWNSVFLPGKTPVVRACLEGLKVMVLMSISICMMIAVGKL